MIATIQVPRNQGVSEGVAGVSKPFLCCNLNSLSRWFRSRRLHSRLWTEHWRIGVIAAPIHRLLDPTFQPPVRWLTPRESRGYWADPFPVPGVADQIYAERFDESTGLGTIERLILRGGALTRVHRPADTPGAATAAGLELVGSGTHVSFPNAFVIDGRCHGVAETGASRQCLLYDIDDSGAWHSPRILLNDVAAADPAIFFRNGLYWLAYTDVDIGAHDNLCLLHGPSVAGPWTPHRCSPVVRGPESSRMAGAYFDHEGALYRPAQDCSVTYGGAVVINRVDICTPEHYRETRVRVLAPEPGGPLPDGLHTLTAWGERTLVDGKRMTIVPSVIARRAWRKLMRPLRAAVDERP